MRISDWSSDVCSSDLFKDDATAFNNQKKGTISGKGVLNNRISEHIFTLLGQIGIPTHFIRRLNMREQLVRQVEIIPVEVVVRNVAAGTLSKRLGIEEGTALPRAILEYFYRSEEHTSELQSLMRKLVCRLLLE